MDQIFPKTLPPTYNPTDIYHQELSNDQAWTLAMLLPKNYSFQIDPHRKETKAQPKKKTPEELPISKPEVSQKPKTIAASVTAIPSKKGAQKQQTINEVVKPCVKTLEMLKQHKCAWPFVEPVDVDGLNIPEYLQIVKEPMDLSTIELKLKGGKYQTPTQFHQDVIKIFNNSYLFNQANENFVKITIQLQKFYYRISGETKPAKPTQDKPSIKPLLAPSKSQKKKKKSLIGSRQLNDSQPMTIQQKKQLTFHLHRLAKEHIKGVKSIIFDNNSDQNEFDLQLLSQKKLRELQKYVKSKISEMEDNLRSSMIEKPQQQNLDELQSDITEQFIDQSLQKHENLA